MLSYYKSIIVGRNVRYNQRVYCQFITNGPLPACLPACHFGSHFFLYWGLFIVKGDTVHTLINSLKQL